MILYLQLLWTFFKIGALSFGGGLGMVPVIQREMQLTGWMTEQEVADIVAISEMTPGPIAINAATFAGSRTGGILGGVIATIGVSLPSIVLSMLAAKFFFAVRDSKIVSAGMTGIRPAVSGMVGASAVQLLLISVFGMQIGGLTVGIQYVDWFYLIVAVVSFLLLIRKVSPALLIILSGLAGLLWHLANKFIL
ncbi:MAG: chromate transporter [Oscillospiraceae bacterium]|nr:chromate transporter [Oscillospiraceae bacterium]MDD4414075.1 chromate transporter [Oscillospiraceae bacterium]